jgi:hypothetical protein
VQGVFIDQAIPSPVRVSSIHTLIAQSMRGAPCASQVGGTFTTKATRQVRSETGLSVRSENSTLHMTGLAIMLGAIAIQMLVLKMSQSVA